MDWLGCWILFAGSECSDKRHYLDAILFKWRVDRSGDSYELHRWQVLWISYATMNLRSAWIGVQMIMTTLHSHERHSETHQIEKFMGRIADYTQVQDKMTPYHTVYAGGNSNSSNSDMESS